MPTWSLTDTDGVDGAESEPDTWYLVIPQLFAALIANGSSL